FMNIFWEAPGKRKEAGHYSGLLEQHLNFCWSHYFQRQKHTMSGVSGLSPDVVTNWGRAGDTKIRAWGGFWKAGGDELQVNPRSRPQNASGPSSAPPATGRQC